MVRSQFSVNHNFAVKFHGFLGHDATNRAKKETTNMKTSFTQILFFILFQIAFRLVGEQTISLYPKILLFLMVDVCMIAIALFEWFVVVSDWHFWLLKVFV